MDRLTLEQRKEIDEHLEGYANNPSNSNKWRTSLHAYVEELIEVERFRMKRDMLSDFIIECYNHDDPMEIAKETEAERRLTETYLSKIKGGKR